MMSGPDLDVWTVHDGWRIAFVHYRARPWWRHLFWILPLVRCIFCCRLSVVSVLAEHAPRARLFVASLDLLETHIAKA